MIVGVVAAGYAAASAIMGPVAIALIDVYGWRATFRLLALAFVITVSIGTYLIENPPEDSRTVNGQPDQPLQSDTQLPTSAMLMLPTFWALWFAFCFGTMSGQLVISQLVPFARSAGLGALSATLAIPVAAAGNVGGRVVSGFLSDRFGRIRTVRWMIVASAILMPALYVFREQAILFFVFVAGVYWCYGSQMSVFASTCADLYGTAHLGLNWGVLLTGWGVAGIIGPITAGWAFDRFHSYQYAFIAASVLAIAAVAILTLINERMPPIGVTKQW